MTVKLLIDVNLSPKWAPVLRDLGWPTIHWSDIGDPRATEDTIMAWARLNDHVVLTHDLDFGTMLALSGESGPSGTAAPKFGQAGGGVEVSFVQACPPGTVVGQTREQER